MYVAPERALVFEVIGPVANFINAARAAGLEWLAEDFPDESAGDEEDPEDAEQDESAVSVLYITMPSLAGLQRLTALWRRYVRGESRPSDAREWWALFGYLSDIRPWSAKDRIDPTLSTFVERSIARHPDRPIRLELDLWYRSDRSLRLRARDYVEALMEHVQGRLLDFETIEPIQYQAALIEIPGREAELLRQLAGPIASADPVMRVRPQSLFVDELKEVGLEAAEAAPMPSAPDARPAVAALIDGYPVQNHALLANRIDVEEVEISGADVPVSKRSHGTAMASLILHGDIAAAEEPLTRTLKVVPILAAPQGMHQECTPPEKLPLAMVYRAVLALKEGFNGSPAKGESVVVLNHSVCDQQGPFTRRPSAWAKLLDYLSHRYRLLFVVSAGNISDPFYVDTYTDVAAFQSAAALERQVVLLRSLEASKGGRTLLSPAEATNALTVGAIHEDASSAVPSGWIDPFAQIGLTNLGSAAGLGVNRTIKPDLVSPGGRQVAANDADASGLTVWADECGLLGQLAAAPDPVGGDTTKVKRSTGTSNAAALTTRAALRLVDVVEELFADDGDDWLQSPSRAVILKTLLAHGCSWQDTGKVLDAIYPPREAKRWQRRRESISRFLGYGRLDTSKLLGPDGRRITLLADDSIRHDQSHRYVIPIPRAMLNNRDVRRVTLTLGWSSPIDPQSARYRGVGLEFVDEDGKRGFWDGVKAIAQPHPDAGRRGTLQHVVLEDKKQITSVQQGGFVIGVQARAPIAAFEGHDVPYALAVTLEVAQSVRQDLFLDVAERVRPKRVRAAVPSGIRVRG